VARVDPASAVLAAPVVRVAAAKAGQASGVLVALEDKVRAVLDKDPAEAALVDPAVPAEAKADLDSEVLDRDLADRAALVDPVVRVRVLDPSRRFSTS
jgi:hypothetical protein